MCFNNIIVFSSSFVDHKVHLSTVLKLLDPTGVTLKRSKSKSLHVEVENLENVIMPSALAIARNMIHSFQEATTSYTIRGT